MDANTFISLKDQEVEITSMEHNQAEATGGEINPDVKAVTCKAVESGNLKDQPPTMAMQEVLEQVEKLKLKRVRLSGAQLRKLKREQAIAEGKEVIPRKRKPRKSKHQKAGGGTAGQLPGSRNDPSGGGTQSTVRQSDEERRKQGAMLADSLPGGSCSSGGEDAAGAGKRLRSEGSTPGQNNKKPRVQDPERKGMLHSEAVKAYKMAVVLSDFPGSKMTDEMAETTQNILVGEMLSFDKEGTAPQFSNCYLEKGALLVTCSNQETKKWLEEITPTLQIGDNVKLRVGSAKQILGVHKVSLWIPKPMNRVPAEQALRLLWTQNKGLRTSEWTVVNRKEESLGQTLVLFIDKSSLEVIRASGLRAHLGMTRVAFKVLSEA
jgi:hypothetical protein